MICQHDDSDLNYAVETHRICSNLIRKGTKVQYVVIWSEKGTKVQIWSEKAHIKVHLLLDSDLHEFKIMHLHLIMRSGKTCQMSQNDILKNGLK